MLDIGMSSEEDYQSVGADGAILSGAKKVRKT